MPESRLLDHAMVGGVADTDSGIVFYLWRMPSK